MNKNHPKTPVFFYGRVSSKGQAGSTKDGLHRQERTVRDYADAHGFEIVKVYTDAVTGTTEHRVQLQEMLLSLRLNGHAVKTVIIEKLDRLSRTLLTQESIILDFKKHGVKLISAMEGEDLLDGDASRTFIRQMFGCVAQYDKEMLCEKLRAARNRKKEITGKCEGQKKISDSIEGYAVINLIKKLRKADKYGRKTKTFDQIAEMLNADGHTTKNGKRFTMANVANIYNRYVK